MYISEERVSHLAHKVVEKLWRDDLADIAEEGRTLNLVKESIAGYFSVLEEIDLAVRKKLESYSATKVPGSREWEVYYQQFYREELAKKKW